MLTTRFIVSLFLTVMTALGVGVVAGQDYPSKPIRILTSLAGSGNDAAARLIA